MKWRERAHDRNTSRVRPGNPVRLFFGQVNALAGWCRRHRRRRRCRFRPHPLPSVTALERVPPLVLQLRGARESAEWNRVGKKQIYVHVHQDADPGRMRRAVFSSGAEVFKIPCDIRTYVQNVLPYAFFFFNFT